MKIKALVTLGVKEQMLPAGSIVELPDQEAAELVAEGYVEPVDVRRGRGKAEVEADR